MTREEWKLSKQSIRELLGIFELHGAMTGREIRYKFAIEYNPMYGFYHIWNGVSKNTICTIRMTRRKVIVRYRPNSHYRYEIGKMNFSNRELVLIPSKSLSRHRVWVLRRVQEAVEEDIARVRSFLDHKIKQYHGFILRIPLIPQVTQSPLEPVKIIGIQFPSEIEMIRLRPEVLRIVSTLFENGQTLFNHDDIIDYTEILSYNRSFVEDALQRYRQEYNTNMTDNVYNINQLQQNNDDLEQLRNIMRDYQEQDCIIGTNITGSIDV